MRLDGFSAAQRAHVVRAKSGYNAFVPPPLPPAVELSHALARRLSSADRALGELAGMARTIANPALLSQTMMRREAVLSSRIEGTRSSLSDLVLFEVERPTGAASDDAREVFNYLAALDHLIAPGRRFPVSLPLLKEAHALLFDGVRGASTATPGDFRRSQNWIGASGSLLADAAYVPPPPEQMWSALDAFEKYLHADHELPPLLTLAAVHYQFEAIHPFLDGNGRIGRLLVILLLVEWGILPAPVLDVSAYIEPRRDRYYDGLLKVSTQGDWPTWFAFFLEIVEEQARDAVRRAARLQALRDDYRARVATVGSSGLLGLLVDEVFRVPGLTIGRAQEVLGVTHRTAALNIEKLVKAGVLVELAGHARPRLFIASGILDVLDGAGAD
ncbi:Fic family protein [Jiangella mangrovi]|uniref:Fic family protein n=1 Tax=Jiangella mangrovi TaxID=1524084 RepID=A0A7W9GNN8_9ACTN|nr:Fic family protein [Jiangella mangrovi]MBB5787014.1 Fic family protein [Jiangella mangrovi]